MKRALLQLAAFIYVLTCATVAVVIMGMWFKYVFDPVMRWIFG